MYVNGIRVETMGAFRRLRKTTYGGLELGQAFTHMDAPWPVRERSDGTLWLPCRYEPDDEYPLTDKHPVWVEKGGE